MRVAGGKEMGRARGRLDYTLLVCNSLHVQVMTTQTLRCSRETESSGKRKKIGQVF